MEAYERGRGRRGEREELMINVIPREPQVGREKAGEGGEEREREKLYDKLSPKESLRWGVFFLRKGGMRGGRGGRVGGRGRERSFMINFYPKEQPQVGSFFLRKGE